MNQLYVKFTHEISYVGEGEARRCPGYLRSHARRAAKLTSTEIHISTRCTSENWKLRKNVNRRELSRGLGFSQISRNSLFPYTHRREAGGREGG